MLFSKNRLLLILTVSLLAASPPFVRAEIFEYDHGSDRNAVLEEAKFRLFIPEDLNRVRAVLVWVPGRNGDGRGKAENKGWQDFARENEIAFLACFLRGTKEDYSTYQTNDRGYTVEVIDKALEELAKESGHSEIADAPLALFGHSAGSNVSMLYAKHNPRPTIAVVAAKGPMGHGEVDSGNKRVPILAIVGAKDKPDWVKGSREAYEKGIQARAVWALAFHPNEGHGGTGSDELIKAYISALIDQRVATGQSTLKSVSKTEGWLADPESREIGSYSRFTGRKSDASWLPDEASAEAWKAYLER